MGAQGVACEITQAQRLRIGQHIHRMVLPLTNKLVSEPPLYIYIHTPF